MAYTTTLRSITRTAASTYSNGTTALHATAVRSSRSISMILHETTSIPSRNSNATRTGTRTTTNTNTDYPHHTTRNFSSPVANHTTGNGNQDIATMLLLLSPTPASSDFNPSSSRKSDCPDDTTCSDKAKEEEEEPFPRSSADNDNCRHQRDDHTLKLKKKDIAQFLS